MTTETTETEPIEVETCEGCRPVVYPFPSGGVSSRDSHPYHRDCGGTVLSGDDHRYCDRCDAVWWDEDGEV